MKRTWSLFLSACMLAGASAAADTATVTRQDISHTVFGLGEVQPISQPGVYAQIDAEVSRVLVGVGDAVKKGDLLMEL
ncbi:MAG: biotin/lipoyl-binding protein, partial [Clostridia bacterium]|nr:biotin/lipoyl-binding protein [Clostridia bacterium]